MDRKFNRKTHFKYALLNRPFGTSNVSSAMANMTVKRSQTFSFVLTLTVRESLKCSALCYDVNWKRRDRFNEDGVTR